MSSQQSVISTHSSGSSQDQSASQGVSQLQGDALRVNAIVGGGMGEGDIVWFVVD